MNDAFRVDGTRRRSSVLRRVVTFVSALMLLAGSAATAAVMTVPEWFLFNKRLALNILELRTNVALEALDLRTPDGLTLRSWYHPPSSGKPVIVYFPGRDGDLIRKSSHLFKLAEEGYGLTLVGYRGFGGNPGSPSEFYFYRDAEALIGKLSREKLAPDGFVLYGYSMGTGVASYAAMKSEAQALILEGAFTSFPAAVRLQVPTIPTWLIRTHFDTTQRIPYIDEPILFLAGENDTITPPTFAEKLASLSKGVSWLQILPGAGHLDMYRHGALEFVADFLGDLTVITTVAETGETGTSL